MKAERYNPLTYSKKLQDSGLETKIADTIAQQEAEIISNMLTNEMATKSDIQKLSMDLVKLELKLGTLIVKGLSSLGGILIVAMAILKYLPNK